MSNKRKRSSVIKQNSKIVKFSYIASAVVLVICGIFLAYSIKTNHDVKQWEEKVLPGVRVNSVDLTGKTKKEVIQILNDNFTSLLGSKKLNISVGDKTFTYLYSDMDVKYDVEKTADEVVNYGKDKNIFNQKSIINKKEKIDFNIELTYNEDKINNIENEIEGKVATEPKDASIKINNGNIEVIPDEEGHVLDKKDFVKKIKKVLNGDFTSNETNVEFKLITKRSAKNAEVLSKIKATPMSSFSTDFSSSNSDRAFNVQFAASLVNGTILLPGEEFSYSKITQQGIGKYRYAAVYVNNKVEQAEAGGICQVSSTLYRAVMRANIKSTERHNHSLTVGYAEKGLDATVAWGNLDYRFVNTYDFPIYLEAVTNNGKVTFNIYGDPDALNGYTYDLANEILETYEPSVTYENATDLPIGTEVVSTTGQTGYKVKSYLVKYKDGVEVDREVISTDIYNMTKTVIRKGTAAIAPPPNTTPEQNTQDTTNTQPDVNNNNQTGENNQDINNSSDNIIDQNLGNNMPGLNDIFQ